VTVKVDNWLVNTSCCLCAVVCANRFSYSNAVQFLKKFDVHRASSCNVLKMM
jgi:hypothetical protein